MDAREEELAREEEDNRQPEFILAGLNQQAEEKAKEESEEEAEEQSEEEDTEILPVPKQQAEKQAEAKQPAKQPPTPKEPAKEESEEESEEDYLPKQPAKKPSEVKKPAKKTPRAKQPARETRKAKEQSEEESEEEDSQPIRKQRAKRTAREKRESDLPFVLDPWAPWPDTEGMGFVQPRGGWGQTITLTLPDPTKPIRDPAFLGGTCSLLRSWVLAQPMFAYKYPDAFKNVTLVHKLARQEAMSGKKRGAENWPQVVCDTARDVSAKPPAMLPPKGPKKPYTVRIGAARKDRKKQNQKTKNNDKEEEEDGEEEEEDEI